MKYKSLLSLLLMTLLISIVTPFTQAVNDSYIIVAHDEFTYNRNHWSIPKIANLAVNFNMGKIIIDNQNKKVPCYITRPDPEDVEPGFLESSLDKSLDFYIMDDNVDFKADLLLQHVSGADSHFAGILFQNAVFSYGCIGISKTRYTIQKNTFVESKILASGKCRTISKDGANLLTVKKIASKLLLYVNNEKVTEILYNPIFTGKIGFFADAGTKVMIDNLIVSEKSNPELQIFENVVFREDFVSNLNQWSEIDTKDAMTKLEDGVYFIESKDIGWITSKPVKINEKRDFKISGTVIKISGSENTTREIVWGLKDTDNFFTFGINEKGYFIVGKYEAGKWQSIIDWTYSKYINTGGNAPNQLTVKKSGNQFVFFINDMNVGQRPYQPFFGEYVGVYVSGKTKAAVDNLIVTQYTIGSEK